MSEVDASGPAPGQRKRQWVSWQEREKVRREKARAWQAKRREADREKARAYLRAWRASQKQAARAREAASDVQP